MLHANHKIGKNIKKNQYLHEVSPPFAQIRAAIESGMESTRHCHILMIVLLQCCTLIRAAMTSDFVFSIWHHLICQCVAVNPNITLRQQSRQLDHDGITVIKSTVHCQLKEKGFASVVPDRKSCLTSHNAH